MTINAPNSVTEIIEKLQSYGFEAYIVGGCVRDSLLGKIPQDWDIATSANPSEAAACFKESKVVPTGIKHGTISLIFKGSNYEITTFRTEGRYSDLRHPDSVEFTKSLREDLSRRDFTINAMAWNEKTGLIDFFNGEQDLQLKIIRTVGNACERFSEDALRILRCLRFASVLNFSIEQDTANAVHKLKDRLGAIAKERIREELIKAINGVNFYEVFLHYADILIKCIPELEENFDYAIYEKKLKAICNSPDDYIIRFALLLQPQKNYDDDNDDNIDIFSVDNNQHPDKKTQVTTVTAEKILRRLRFTTNEVKQILQLLLYSDIKIPGSKPEIKTLLNNIGETQFFRLMNMKRAMLKSLNTSDNVELLMKPLINAEKAAKLILDNGECYSISGLKINGNDLKVLGFKDGVQIGHVLNLLTMAVVNEEVLNDKPMLVQYATDMFANDCI